MPLDDGRIQQDRSFNTRQWLCTRETAITPVNDDKSTTETTITPEDDGRVQEGKHYASR